MTERGQNVQIAKVAAWRKRPTARFRTIDHNKNITFTHYKKTIR